MIRLTTLGAARVHRGDTAFPDLPAQRLRFALLLYLAVEQDVSRDEVVTMFWPDRDTGRGKHALRQMLYELRQVLGEDWVELGRDRIVVKASVDLIAFERAVEEGRTQEALSLYGGPFLQGFALDNRSFEAWTDRRGAHVARMHRRLRREHVAQLVEAGRRDDALSAAREWVELDPVDDEAAHTLIERLLAAGQRSAALTFYDTYARQLKAELDVEPLEETQALIARVRSGDTAAPAGGDMDPAAPAALSTAPSSHSAPAEPAHAMRGQGSGSTAGVQPRAAGRAASAESSRRPWLPRSLARRAAAVLLLLSAGVSSALVVTTMRDESLATRKATVAILPFTDRSEDGTLAPLAGALTDALVSGLTRGESINVISPNGVLQKREQGASEASLGRALDADYLIRGSVSRYDDTGHIYVELVDARTNHVIRSDPFERPWSDSRYLMEDAARATTQLLRQHISSTIRIAQVEAGKLDENAWRLVSEAKAAVASTVTLIQTRDYEAAEDVFLATDSMLEQAALLDERWAEPVLLRGEVREGRAFLLGMQRRTPEVTAARRAHLEEGLPYADAAERREPGAAGARALRGALLKQLASLQEDPDSVATLMAVAEAELKSALQLDPTDQRTASHLADLLNSTERYGEAHVVAQQAYRLDPYSHEVRHLTYLLFITALEAGEDRSAEGWCFQGRGAFPNDLIFKYCMLALHAWADRIVPRPEELREEIKQIEQSQRMSQPHLEQRFHGMLAAAYARAGQQDSARALLKRNEAMETGDLGALWMRASAYAQLGEDSTALALLDEWLKDGDWRAARVARSRPFHHLRERSNLDAIISARTSVSLAATERGGGSISPTHR